MEVTFLTQNSNPNIFHIKNKDFFIYLQDNVVNKNEYEIVCQINDGIYVDKTNTTIVLARYSKMEITDYVIKEIYYQIVRGNGNAFINIEKIQDEYNSKFVIRDASKFFTRDNWGE